MTELGTDKSLFWPNWVTINTERSLNRSQEPNSATGRPNSVPPYNQINQVGLHNYFYRHRYVFTRVTSEFMGRWKSKNIRQIRMLMGDKFVSKTRIPAVFRGFWATLCVKVNVNKAKLSHPEDVEMTEMTLPSRHRIRKAWCRARYLSVTEVPHNIESLRVHEEETFCFFETRRPELGSTLRSPIFQADSFNHCTRAPASVIKESFRKFNLNAIDQELIHTQAPQTLASNQLEELCSQPEYQFNHARRLKRPPWFNRQRTEWHGIGVFFI